MTTAPQDALDLLLQERPWLRPTYGLHIRPGWRPIAASALREIAQIADQSDVSVEIAEVKEKFGRLRITVDPVSVRARFKDVLTRAEHQAGTTCDVCGAAGSLRGPMWWRTRCDAHADS